MTSRPVDWRGDSCCSSSCASKKVSSSKRMTDGQRRNSEGEGWTTALCSDTPFDIDAGARGTSSTKSCFSKLLLDSFESGFRELDGTELIELVSSEEVSAAPSRLALLRREQQQPILAWALGSAWGYGIAQSSKLSWADRGDLRQAPAVQGPGSHKRSRDPRKEASGKWPSARELDRLQTTSRTRGSQLPITPRTAAFHLFENFSNL